ncbi:aldose epimerase family protein [Sutcliffiella halmapala]|uniref:aldose epimerase family protein n=1 Tax=Sutcliffiella halmapala TaxID=79882 RepID=UPI00099582AF|nr:aldose epimerase family protein [Sutcliffiella halmapala]
MKVEQRKIGMINNQSVYAFTLINNHGIEVECINYGCIITKILMPDQFGALENIVLGYETLDEYIKDECFFGCIVGRTAGRIGGASFELDGKTYSLEKNEANNNLHGGSKSFNRVVWDASSIQNEREVGVQFSYHSPDGEGGYPGNLLMKVTYLLTNNNELTIQYEGVSDKTTLLNVTNHSYFNLSGNAKRDILDHSLTMKSSSFLQLNSELLPTGEILNVDGTAFDFQLGKSIKAGVVSNHPQNVMVGNGFDHPFLLDTNHDSEIVLYDEMNGRRLTVETDEPGVVVYTSNMLSEGIEINGVPSRQYLGICLETQGLPDAIHHPNFSSWILDKDQKYSSMTKFRFGIVGTSDKAN